MGREVVMAVLLKNVKSIYPKPLASSWEQLRELLAFHEENAVKTDGALWSPVEYYPSTTRGNRNVRFIEALVVDMDGESFREARLDGLEWFAYSTYSHRDDDPHYHLVLPLAERVPASLWRAVWQGLHERLNLVGDPQTKDPARLFYLPQHAPGQTFEFHEGHGVLLDTDFSWDVVEQSKPVQSRQVRQPRERRHESVLLSEAWWNEPADLSRWDGLKGRDLHDAMRAEFRALRQQLEASE
jgi:putative DNA primase/helicase